MRYHPSLQYVYGEFVKAMTDMFCLENLSKLWWICSVWRISQGYDEYVLLVLVTMRSFFHFVWRFLTRLARRMSKVEPELHIRPVHSQSCVGFDLLRERPFNLKEGGSYVFLLKKYSDSQCCWKIYSDVGGGKKNNLIQSFCHIT